MAIDTDKLRDFAQATFEKQQAEALVKDRKRKIDELDPQIRQMFVEEGVPGSSITVQARDIDAEAFESVISWFGDSDDADTLADKIVGELREKGLLAESTPEYTKTLSIGSRVWAKRK
jgi:hypothetical protein